MSEVEPGFAPFGADASPEPETEVVEAEAEAEEVEGEESEAESPSAEETEQKPDPFQERIDKLTKNWRATERDLTEIQRERDDLKRRLDELAKPADDTPKTLADFDFDEIKYQDYVFAQAERRAEKAAEKVAQGYTTKIQEERLQQAYDKRESEFAKTVKDFDDVAKDRHLPVTKTMADEIKGSDIGPEMLYFLGKNPEEAASIARMPERQAIRAMVMLEGKLQDAKSKAKSNKVSDAPPPPSNKVRGSEPGLRVSTTDPKSDKMSDKEWFAAEALRQAKARGG